MELNKGVEIVLKVAGPVITWYHYCYYYLQQNKMYCDYNQLVLRNKSPL